jgi:serine O-acetyltransferase
VIKNKADYKYYCRQDAQNGTFELNIKEWLLNDIWRFLRALRFAEYVHNTKHGRLWSLIRLWSKYRYKSIGKKLGYSIPINVFGPGLCLPHYGNIVVNKEVRVGANCKIHVGVNIGADFYDSIKAPKLGDNCYIAPGAKLFGGISLGNGTKVGANAVVNKTFEGDNLVLLGVPAKPVKKLKI